MKKKILGIGIVTILIVILLTLTGCGDKKETNNTEKKQEESSLENSTEDNKSVSTNLKIDARYKGELDNGNKFVQVDLYSDNTIYYEYITRATIEYYTGTYTINGNKLEITLVPDDSNVQNTAVTENPKEYTILSDEQFKDKDNNIYKYTIDYKKGVLPNEQ